MITDPLVTDSLRDAGDDMVALEASEPSVLVEIGMAWLRRAVYAERSAGLEISWVEYQDHTSVLKRKIALLEGEIGNLVKRLEGKEQLLRSTTQDLEDRVMLLKLLKEK